MGKFTAWLTTSAGSLKVREVTISADTERQAYHAALLKCRPDEFVRGVMPAREEQ